MWHGWSFGHQLQQIPIIQLQLIYMSNVGNFSHMETTTPMELDTQATVDEKWPKESNIAGVLGALCGEMIGTI